MCYYPIEVYTVADEPKPGDRHANRLPEPEKKHKITPQMKAAQYPKGVSGNPRGRPKSKPITDQIKKILERKVKDKDYTYLELFAFRNVMRALQGNNAMTREVWNRIEGILPRGAEGR